MLKVVIAIFIVLCICTLATTAGCMKASSMDNDKDFIDWEEEVRKWKNEKI